MAKVKKNIEKALERVSEEISGLFHKNDESGNSKSMLYASGLAPEGYAGGYRQALWDIKLVLNNVKPNTRNYWDDFEY